MARALNPPNDATHANHGSYFAELFDHETRPADAPKQARRAAGPCAPDKEALLVLGERMRRSARHHQQALSLLVLQVPELPELEILFGRQAANEAVRAVMEVLAAVARSRGLAVRTTPDTFALLMPGCTGEKLQAVLRCRLGHTCSVEVDFEGEEIVLVPEFQARTLEAGQTVETTYSVVCRAIESQRYMEQLRRDHQRREREAHSTHMSLPPELAHRPALPPDRAWRPTLPATIVMPMGLG